MITAIGIVALKVQDWAAMIAWYRDVLGLHAQVLDEPNGYAIFEVGSVRMAVEKGGVASTFPKGAGQNPVNINFRTDDLEAGVSELRKKGVGVLTPVRSGSGYNYVMFVDPEGNQYVLYQRTKR
jgi:predicted enzyme related to lactoylglutathione lyase